MLNISMSLSCYGFLTCSLNSILWLMNLMKPWNGLSISESHFKLICDWQLPMSKLLKWASDDLLQQRKLETIQENDTNMITNTSKLLRSFIQFNKLREDYETCNTSHNFRECCWANSLLLLWSARWTLRFPTIFNITTCTFNFWVSGIHGVV